MAGALRRVLHGESNTGQASPRTPTQRTIQPQEAVQPQRNQSILQADTPAQKANYSYKRSHPTPCVSTGTTHEVFFIDLSFSCMRMRDVGKNMDTIVLSGLCA